MYQSFAVIEISEQLFGIVRGTADAEPQHVDGNAGLDHLQPRRLPGDGVPAVAPDYQVGMDLYRPVRGPGAHSGDLPAIANQVNRLMLHFADRSEGNFCAWPERKSRKSHCGISATNLQCVGTRLRLATSNV